MYVLARLLGDVWGLPCLKKAVKGLVSLGQHINIVQKEKSMSGQEFNVLYEAKNIRIKWPGQEKRYPLLIPQILFLHAE